MQEVASIAKGFLIVLDYRKNNVGTVVSFNSKGHVFHPLKIAARYI